mmetsp:Transcript_33749/g.54001  ORF Transcript_33749/g.54001 Transcript_33749/m.54001 type:complete len:210 (-) Transcript_33749:8-637(-)
MSATQQKQLGWLIDGYLKQLSSLYPLELNAVIVTFLGNILFKFDSVHEKYRHCIQNNGRTVSRPKVDNDADLVLFSICSSTKFEVGINQFTVKCVKNPRDNSIGIMSNTSICDKEDAHHFYAEANAYYLHGCGSIFCSSKTANAKTYTHDLSRRCQKNDMVTIIVNCDRWTVQFIVNKQPLGTPIDIVPGAYHAFIGTVDHDTEFELVL